MTTKVFVGNLAFQTTDQALAEAFQDCGKVKSGVVITRGRRSLGYGFVEFENPDSALEAVKSKNNSLFKERTLKVELASDNPIRADRPERGPLNPAGGQGGGANPNTGGSPSNNNAGGVGQNQQGGGDQRKKRTTRRRRKPINKDNQQGGNQGQNTGNPNQDRPPRNNNNNQQQSGGGSGDLKPRRTNRRKNYTNKNQNQNNQNNQNSPPPSGEPRILSKTAVFVANLPFGVQDNELLQFFKEHNAKTAHVVVTRNGRSRGYGFVDFVTEEDQKNAIAAKNHLKFPPYDREITVTASYKPPEVAAN